MFYSVKHLLAEGRGGQRSSRLRRWFSSEHKRIKNRRSTRREGEMPPPQKKSLNAQMKAEGRGVGQDVLEEVFFPTGLRQRTYRTP